MKKVLFLFIIISVFNIDIVKAENITFDECVDGDTVKLKIDGKVEKIRFLAIDTPETKHPTKGSEPFGKEASNYTCISVKEAKEIKLEYEKDKRDNYDRVLAWVFLDGNLLQDKLVKKGLARVAYLYDDYKYTEKLQKSEIFAKKNKLGVWSDYKDDYSQILKYVGIILIVLILCIYDKSYRKKTIGNVKRKANREFNKLLK